MLTKEIFLMSDAYFIHPTGKIIPVEYGKHINELLRKPEQFGYTREHIFDVHKKYNERPGIEGKAREELLNNLIDNGWGHARVYGNFVAINIKDSSPKSINPISDLAKELQKNPNIGNSTPARIYSLKQNKIIANTEVGKIANDGLYRSIEENATIPPKSFKLFTEEMKQVLTEGGNPLWQKLGKWLDKNSTLVGISPNRDHFTPEQTKLGVQLLGKGLEDARVNGHIGGWTGPHNGGYTGENKNEISREPSFFVYPKSDSQNDIDKMLKVTYHYADNLFPEKNDNQESIAVITPDRKIWWQYMNNSTRPGDVEHKGSVTHKYEYGVNTGFTELEKKKQYVFSNTKETKLDNPYEHDGVYRLKQLYKRFITG
jgi:hypothetical protein